MKGRILSILAPLLILVALAAPSIDFLLPATHDYLGEIYQPLRALKFFKTGGTAFHKYGPMPNFVLAPGYATTLAYWKVKGTLKNPTDDFPYGFDRPFEQMGFLIWQGRVLFLAIGVAGFGYLAYTLHLLTPNRWAVAFALLFCLTTNYALVEQLPTPRPDSGMLAFSALALAVYVRMLELGVTVRRGVWFSIWAVFATSSKELAGTMFVLPFLGLIWLAWREKGHDGRRAIYWSFITGVVSYTLLNIVYAPLTWMQRIRFWLAGPGIDAEVWGGGSGLMERFVNLGEVLLNNLGPGGSLVVPLALIAFLLGYQRRWLLLLLPALSVAGLGLGRIAYPADRFYTILCLALLPAVALGLDALIRHARPIATPTMLVLAVINIWFGTFAFIQREGRLEYLAEQHALKQSDEDAMFYIVYNFPQTPGASRLNYLGLRSDPRSFQQLAAQRTDLPDWVYAARGKLQFFEDARRLPARAAMLKDGSGFDVATWKGMGDLGYRRDQTLVPRTPAWFWFDWMPAVRRWRPLRAVEVYRLSPDAIQDNENPATRTREPW